MFNVAKEMWLKESHLVIYEEEESSFESWKRKEFDKMIQTLEIDSKKWKKREYGWIIFFKIDRLARNNNDFKRLDELFSNGYELISVTETIENTPTGRLLFRMLSNFAIYESEKLSNRQSLTQIHNILRENYHKLWWTATIFWYELNENGFFINKAEAEIVQYIYMFYSRHEIQNITVTEENIMTTINEEYKDTLQKCRKQFQGWLTKRQVHNTLHNDNMLLYNWFIERKLNINDELIMNYTKEIQNNNRHDKLDIQWNPKIWGSLTFVMYYEHLRIIDDILYQKVQNIKQTKKRNKKDTFIPALFNTYLYIERNGQEYLVNKPEIKKVKYVQYRKSFKNKNKIKSYGISEKRIEDAIATLKIGKKIRLQKKKLLSIQKKLIKQNKSDQDKELRSIQWSALHYHHTIAFCNKGIQFAKNTTELRMFQEEKQQYQRLLNELLDKKKNIIDVYNTRISNYLSLFEIKAIKKEQFWRKKQYYRSIIEKITYDKDKRITIYLFDLSPNSHDYQRKQLSSVCKSFFLWTSRKKP